MKHRFFQFNKAFTYIGELNKEKLGRVIADIVSSLPIYLTKMATDVTIYQFDNNQIVSIDIRYYLSKGVISEDEAGNLFKSTEAELMEAIKTELHNQKLIFALD